MMAKVITLIGAILLHSCTSLPIQVDYVPSTGHASSYISNRFIPATQAVTLAHPPTVVAHAPLLGVGHAPILGVEHAPLLDTGHASILGAAHAPIFGVGHAPVLGAGHASILGAGHGPIFGVGHAPALGAGHASILGAGHAPIFGVGHAPVFSVNHAPALAVSSHPAVPVVSKLVYPDSYPKYSFAYGVKDLHSGDQKEQQETRDGDIVHGSYSLIEPDGSRRIVEYSADDHNGFNAIVHREPVHHHQAVAHTPAIATIAHAPAIATLAHVPSLSTSHSTVALTHGTPVIAHAPITVAHGDYGPAALSYLHR